MYSFVVTKWHDIEIVINEICSMINKRYKRKTVPKLVSLCEEHIVNECEITTENMFELLELGMTIGSINVCSISVQFMSKSFDNVKIVLRHETYDRWFNTFKQLLCNMFVSKCDQMAISTESFLKSDTINILENFCHILEYALENDHINIVKYVVLKMDIVLGNKVQNSCNSVDYDIGKLVLLWLLLSKDYADPFPLVKRHIVSYMSKRMFVVIECVPYLKLPIELQQKLYMELSGCIVIEHENNKEQYESDILSFEYDSEDEIIDYEDDLNI